MIKTTLETIDKSVYLKRLLKQMEKTAVYVGVPEETTERTETDWETDSSGRAKKVKVKSDMSNAVLLAIHTKGSPLRGLPARPVVEPAIEDPDNKEKINRQLLLAAKLGVKGDKTGFKQGLEKAGMTAQNLVRDWFVNPKNNWAPLSPATIKAKGSDRPLIDTAQLRKSVSYVVREK